MTIQSKSNIRKTFVSLTSILGLVMFLHIGTSANAGDQEPDEEKAQPRTKEQLQKDSSVAKGMWLPVVTVQPKTAEQ